MSQPMNRVFSQPTNFNKAQSLYNNHTQEQHSYYDNSYNNNGTQQVSPRSNWSYYNKPQTQNNNVFYGANQRFPVQESPQRFEMTNDIEGQGSFHANSNQRSQHEQMVHSHSRYSPNMNHNSPNLNHHSSQQNFYKHSPSSQFIQSMPQTPSLMQSKSYDNICLTYKR